MTDTTNQATLWWLWLYAKENLSHISARGNLRLMVEVDGKTYQVYDADAPRDIDGKYRRLMLKVVEK